MVFARRVDVFSIALFDGCRVRIMKGGWLVNLLSFDDYLFLVGVRSWLMGLFLVFGTAKAVPNTPSSSHHWDSWRVTRRLRKTVEFGGIGFWCLGHLRRVNPRGGAVSPTMS